MDRDRDSDDDGAQHALTEEPENAARSHRSLGGPPSGFGWLQIVMRLIAPAAAALALVSVITNDTRLDADLALVAPGRAEPGSEIPLRALIYSGLNKPEGPALIHAGTRVELKAGDHKTLAQTVLRPGHGPSLEGALRIPSHASGALTLRAYAWAANERVEVERPLIIGAPIAVARAPRALGPLQQLAHGPIRTRPGAIAPSALTVRVAGGACVPEEPCELFVHIGTPAAVIEIAATPSITVEQAPAREPSSGVVGLRIRTHGPEADLELRAIGERAADAATGAASAVIAASRAVRLPIALGADAMQLEHAVLSAPAVPKLAMLGSSASGIADVFADDRWRSSATQRAGVLAPLRIAALEPGLYRVQMRRDPFESESAAVRTLYVRRPGESDGAVLRELAQRVVAHERTLPPDQRDALAAQLAANAANAASASSYELTTTGGYLLAVLDEGIDRLPSAATGYPIARRRALAHREDVRKLALVVLVLAAASLALLLVQRGLLASEQAAAVLRASGTGDAGVRREQLRMTLRVLGAAVAMLLIFCAIALYLIVRGRAQ